MLLREKGVSNETVEASFGLAQQPSQKAECSAPWPCPKGSEDYLQKNKQLMEDPIASPRAKAAAMILLHMSNSCWDQYGFTSDLNCDFKQTGRLKETKGI
eukprot:TRINITY_DN1482_c0_g1_i2.p1 TRINITY_DN1482_c0_g1~~TRINITY_DN1482_c0_g1_i2.p1  ORF type:complete len:100 (+),score=22.29 TRINITY_DN1482_c0_g1_i2:359-658(+)